MSATITDSAAVICCPPSARYCVRLCEGVVKGIRYASIYTVFKRLCLHPGMGVFTGTVYEFVQQS